MLKLWDSYSTMNTLDRNGLMKVRGSLVYISGIWQISGLLFFNQQEWMEATWSFMRVFVYKPKWPIIAYGWSDSMVKTYPNLMYFVCKTGMNHNHQHGRDAAMSYVKSAWISRRLFSSLTTRVGRRFLWQQYVKKTRFLGINLADRNLCTTSFIHVVRIPCHVSVHFWTL